MADTVHFSVRYDGPALSNHTMDVRELAPALLALAHLVEQANKVALPDAAEVSLSVQGNFKSGSFGIDLVAIQSVAEQVISLLAGHGVTATANLITLLNALGFLRGNETCVGLIGLIKRLRGRKPAAIRQEGDRVFVECRDTQTTETIEVDLLTGRLYQSRVVRQNLEKALKPLACEGVDFFAVGQAGQAHAVVESAELAFFTAAAEDEEIVSDTTAHNVLLQIESAVFTEGNKWRFSDGDRAFYAEIADERFLADVESGLRRFGKLDMLLVDLQRIQSITDNGLKTKHIVAKVHEHRGPLQGKLL